jgi:hypothetical protein
MKRSHALRLIECLVPRVEEHLAKLAASPEHSSRSHWKREVWAWLRKIEALVRHVGKKTGAEWEARIAAWRADLEE